MIASFLVGLIVGGVFVGKALNEFVKVEEMTSGRKIVIFKKKVYSLVAEIV